MIMYGEEDVIVAKKKHPCGSFRWKILKTGAEIRMKCEGCGRVALFSPDEVFRMCKTVERNGEERI